MLLLVAPNERKVRIEVGRGLEGTLTNAVAQLIIDDSILPRFRSADFPGGIDRGVDDIIQVLTGDSAVWKGRASTAAWRAAASSWLVAALPFLYFGAIALIVGMVAFAQRMPRGAGSRRGRTSWWSPGFWDWGPSGTWDTSSSSTSWSSFDSGGGFSGGGGDSGGGGASGSW